MATPHFPAILNCTLFPCNDFSFTLIWYSSDFWDIDQWILFEKHLFSRCAAKVIYLMHVENTKLLLNMYVNFYWKWAFIFGFCHRAGERKRECARDVMNICNIQITMTPTGWLFESTDLSVDEMCREIENKNPIYRIITSIIFLRRDKFIIKSTKRDRERGREIVRARLVSVVRVFWTF